MRAILELSPFFPFALRSAVRTFVYHQGSAGTFLSRLSEVYTPARGMYTMFGTYLQVS